MGAVAPHTIPERSEFSLGKRTPSLFSTGIPLPNRAPKSHTTEPLIEAAIAATVIFYQGAMEITVWPVLILGGRLLCFGTTAAQNLFPGVIVVLSNLPLQGKPE